MQILPNYNGLQKRSGIKDFIQHLMYKPRFSFPKEPSQHQQLKGGSDFYIRSPLIERED